MEQLHKEREARGRDKRLVTAATRVQAHYRQVSAAMSRTLAPMGQMHNLHPITSY